MKPFSASPAAGGKRASRSKFSNSGFSLVEVALAVAIAALAIITLLGLLPQGLEMSRKTAQLTNTSNILEQIIRNLENTKWSDIQSQTGQAVMKYYTDQGLEVQSGSDEISYVARIRCTMNPTLPATENEEPYLCKVVINVASTSNLSFNFDSPSTKLSYVTFNHLIARNR